MDQYDQSREPWPWSAIAAAWLLFVGTAVYSFYYDSKVRVVPAESQLAEVTGRFNPASVHYDRGYTFWANDGRQLGLGCEPDTYRAYCLDRISIQQLKQNGVTIKYYPVPDSAWLSHPNVIMSISTSSGEDILTYRQRSSELQHWFDVQAATKKNGTFYILHSLPADVLLFYALIVTVRKFRSSSRGTKSARFDLRGSTNGNLGLRDKY